ncbi:MAG: 7-carboxy-7-deazaguanine synthase QueE [Candidatus Omnitrophica bacterium]|nr:7-carboxy-7-deazaguanine synthase QueE [Candidatus Omnitrophota bacterium]
MKGKIAEIFESIQGEGIYLGEKQLFVRLFGCNLSCKYCDTKLECFREYEPQELLEELKRYRNHYHSVSFTGGEPLLQKDFLKEALRLTSEHNFKNYLETNGTIPGNLEDVIDYVHIVSMDVKLPSSTGLEHFWEQHREFFKIASRKEVFVKAVICNDTQDKDIMEAVRMIKETNRSAVLVLQPNTFEDSRQMRRKLRRIRERCIRHRITACIIPQMHKITWMR